MHHNYAPTGRQTQDPTQVVVHPRLVDLLRRAIYAEIGTAAESLDAAVTAGDREAHPERFRAAGQSLRESYGLLDSLSWTRTEPSVAVTLDLCEDSWALMRALNSAQELAGDEVYEVSRDADGQALACETERLCQLYSFTDEVQGRIDMLAVQEAAEFIPDLAA
jgi:hypothetical protein